MGLRVSILQRGPVPVPVLCLPFIAFAAPAASPLAGQRSQNSAALFASYRF